jgi:hypothetical protein
MVQDSAPLSVFVFVTHSENPRSPKSVVNRTFHKDTRLPIYVVYMFNTGEGNFVWPDPYYWSIFLMPTVDGLCSAALGFCPQQPKIGEFRKKRARKNS